MIKNYATWSGMSKSLRDKLNVLPKSRTIPVVSNKLIPLEPNNNCNKLVSYGSNLGSNVGLKLNISSLNSIYLTPYIKEVLVGLILGDANIIRPGKKGQPQIQYNQGLIHLEHM
jgi:hypothetical protein